MKEYQDEMQFPVHPALSWACQSQTATDSCSLWSKSHMAEFYIEKEPIQWWGNCSGCSQLFWTKQCRHNNQHNPYSSWTYSCQWCKMFCNGGLRTWTRLWWAEFAPPRRIWGHASPGKLGFLQLPRSFCAFWRHTDIKIVSSVFWCIQQSENWEGGGEEGDCPPVLIPVCIIYGAADPTQPMVQDTIFNMPF